MSERSCSCSCCACVHMCVCANLSEQVWGREHGCKRVGGWMSVRVKSPLDEASDRPHIMRTVSSQ